MGVSSPGASMAIPSNPSDSPSRVSSSGLSVLIDDVPIMNEGNSCRSQPAITSNSAFTGTAVSVSNKRQQELKKGLIVNLLEKVMK
jgi:hypothetical protein